MITPHVLRNVLRPAYAPVVARKVVARVTEGQRNRADATAWARRHVSDVEGWTKAIDPALWDEAKAYADDVAGAHRARLERLEVEGVTLGGGGNSPLLYFLTRHLRPPAVLETGVAAGFSSHAILTALRRNGGGELFSSDFPYFRLKDPERYVGILVDDDLREGWHLFLEGDRKNLRTILEREPPPFRLVHYDSDKTYGGRRFVMERIGPHLAPGATVVMDDIQDNLYFAELVERRGGAFAVFESEGYFNGVLTW